jgi:hypothetical protein
MSVSCPGVIQGREVKVKVLPQTYQERIPWLQLVGACTIGLDSPHTLAQGYRKG